MLPSDGEMVSCCCHLTEWGGVIPHEIKFIRFPVSCEIKHPDGTSSRATWFLLCGDCFVNGKGDMRNIPLANKLIEWDSREVRDAAGDHEAS